MIKRIEFDEMSFQFYEDNKLVKVDVKTISLEKQEEYHQEINLKWIIF